jgi:hypothetical protein
VDVAVLAVMGDLVFEFEGLVMSVSLKVIPPLVEYATFISLSADVVPDPLLNGIKILFFVCVDI